MMEKKRGTVHEWKSNSLPALVTVAPVGLWMVLFIAIPLLYVLVLSFCSINEQYNVVFRFTLDNYHRLFNLQYVKIYGQSILIALLATAVCLLAGYPFSWLIARTKSRWKNVLYMLVIIPFWTNSLIRIYGWRTFLGVNGPFNRFLEAVGIIAAPLDMLFHRGTTVLGMAYCLFPFMVLPLYTAIEKVDMSLLEASTDLGAHPWQTFIEVILPLTASGIFSGSIMVFIPTLGYFYVADILGGGNADVIGNLIERQFQSGNNWPLGAALSIILIAITLLLVKLYQCAGGDMKNLGV